MNIKLKQINLESSLEIESYVKWENDLEFYHLIAPMRSKDSKIEMVTVESTINFFKKNPDRLKSTYIVFDKENPIGQISIHIDPDHLYKKVKGTCWIGLTIGEKGYWGTGAAFLAMQELETLAKEMSLKRIELGVFEFNIRAQKFYEKLGYKVIGEIDNFTFWNNRFWRDIRMEKNL